MAFRFEPHTGEVRVRLEAADLPALFVDAAHALCELLGVAADQPPGTWQRVVVTAHDREALLVAWVNELIARTEIDHLLYRDVAIDELGATRVEARIRGVPFSETRTAVKAATMHDLAIEARADGVTATLVLDV